MFRVEHHLLFIDSCIHFTQIFLHTDAKTHKSTLVYVYTVNNSKTYIHEYIICTVDLVVAIGAVHLLGHGGDGAVPRNDDGHHAPSRLYSCNVCVCVCIYDCAFCVCVYIDVQNIGGQYVPRLSGATSINTNSSVRSEVTWGNNRVHV